MPLLANSQTLSTEEYCSVPCRTLKNALLVKAERDFLSDRISILKDSTSILSAIVLTQNKLILNRDSVIVLHQDNEVRYLEMLNNKDQIIGVKDKQIKQEKFKALAGWAVAVLNTTFLVIKLI
jgi:hypothetical protein